MSSMSSRALELQQAAWELTLDEFTAQYGTHMTSVWRGYRDPDYWREPDPEECEV